MEVDKNDIPKQDYLVLCDTITYNHAPYIRDAMDGFTMQQTNFPFVCYIIDDASTDGEQGVIKAYMDEHFQMDNAEFYDLELANVIVAKHNTNPNCTFAVYLLKRNLWKEPTLKYSHRIPWENRCKYIALCEGDDYWTDSMKLQKQVDFLESHPDYSMCFHGADIKNTSNRIAEIACETIETREYFSQDVFPGWLVPTASIVYRCAVVNAYPIVHPEYFKAGDIVLILKCTHTGRVWAMSEHMSVYHMNPGGVMNTEMNDPRLCEQLCKHYQGILLNFPQANKQFCNDFIASYCYTQFRKVKNGGKITHLFKAIQYSPLFVWNKFLKAIHII